MSWSQIAVTARRPFRHFACMVAIGCRSSRRVIEAGHPGLINAASRVRPVGAARRERSAGFKNVRLLTRPDALHIRLAMQLPPYRDCSWKLIAALMLLAGGMGPAF